MAEIGVNRTSTYGACGIVAVLLMMMWLNPFAGGPSPAVMPLVMCWLYSAILLIGGSTDRRLLLTLGLIGPLLVVWAFVSGGGGRSWQDIALFAAGLASISIAALWAAGRDSECWLAMSYAWLIAALLSSGLGLCQYFNLASPMAPWVNVPPVGEAFANLRQRNQFASLTNIGLLALLWFVAQERIRAFALPMAMLLAAGNAASASRTGILQLFLITALTWFWQTPRCSRLLGLCVGAVLAYFVSALSLPWLLQLISGTAGNNVFGRLAGESGCNSRMVLWSNVLELIRQRPLLGWGLNELDYAHYIHLYRGPRFCEILDNAHNLPLHLAVELGIPAAAMICAGSAWLVCRTKPWRDTDPTRQLAWGGISVILLHSMLEYPLWYGPFQITFGLCLGLLWVTSPSAGIAAGRAIGPGRTQKGNRARRVLLTQILLAALTVALLGYSVNSYYRVSQIYLPPSERSPTYRENTLEKIRGTWFFQNQVDFAELSVTGLTPQNAQAINALATRLLHYSPEPRVIEKVIESAAMLGHDEEALAHLARYRAAFPEDYFRWTQLNTRAVDPAPVLK
ncbi:PglL family O-oligosaccharyltransferase [Polaromonas aquatica]|uniref:PglL family O-oligosaccharyltransferase n=1 Tax=Polaromonas aquatica TaxID=332657 RepID=UPI003D654434